VRDELDVARPRRLELLRAILDTQNERHRTSRRTFDALQQPLHLLFALLALAIGGFRFLLGCDAPRFLLRRRCLRKSALNDPVFPTV
jgi:hypothetical protein